MTADARSTTFGYWRCHNDPYRKTAPGIVPCIVQIKDIDATLPGTNINTGFYLPPNAVVMAVDIVGNGTGGTSPLVDVGFSFTVEPGGAVFDGPDGLVDGAPADSDSSTKSISNVKLATSQVEAWVTVSDGGGTNCTGGTIDLYIWYAFDDDGKVND